MRSLGNARLLAFPGIAGRVFLYTAAIVCTVVAAALVVASQSGRRIALDEERRGVEQAADLTAQLLAGRERSLAGGARVFVQGPYFRALVAERRRDDILDQTIEAVQQLGADWVFITDDAGTLLAKSDEPGVRDAPMGGIPLVAGALEGRTTSGYGVSRDSILFQTVGVPIVVPRAAPVGALVATKILDQQTARDVRAATGADVVFYSLDVAGHPHLAASSLGRRQDAAALIAAGAGPDAPRAGDSRAPREARIAGKPYVIQGAALTTSGGDVIGGFVAARPEEVMARQFAGVRLSLLVATLVGLVLALVAAWSAARRVTRPVRALSTAAAQALDGDYEAATAAARQATTGAPRDEIAALGGALASLLGELREKQALVAILGRADGAPEEPERGAPGARPLRMRSGGALAAGAVVAERYALEETLGAGGTGIVYRARDLVLNETIALKVLRPELIAADERAREELKHELRLTRRVSHRNVVRTHDFGSANGVPFLTMEYVEGPSLAQVLAQRGKLPHEVVLALARQLARALEAAHEQGVVHGDLKPANLLLTLDGLLKVTDFGVATLVRRPRAHVLATAEAVVTPPHLAGAVIGTPEYMPPELLIGGVPDARTDVYTAGMVLQECLTGTTPFQSDTPRGFFARKLDAPARRPSDRMITGLDSLEEVIAWMTASDPADRPTSAAAVGEALASLS